MYVRLVFVFTLIVSFLEFMCHRIPLPVPCHLTLDVGELLGEHRHTSGIFRKVVHYCSYKGIPYAVPPIGNLRFKDPVLEPVSWIGRKFARTESKHCVQNDLMYADDSPEDTDENCLYLNVYAPDLSEKATNHSLAVMVFIHGGGFLYGSGNENLYGPDFLIENNVILITFNYRLGVFGFLNLGTSDAPGNMGLKDQVAALKWVKKHIHKFGGDPNRVTIFGESAGAASVHYHILSHASRGLFHRAIMQSGSAFAPWAFNNDVRKAAFTLAELLKCGDSYRNNTKVFAKCFINASSRKLRELQLQVVDSQDLRKGMFFTFLPSIDSHSKTSLIKNHPAKIIANEEFNHVPTLIGFNNREGLMFLMAQEVSDDLLNKINDNFGSVVPSSLGLKEGTKEFKDVMNKIKKFYFNGKPLTWDLIESYCDLVGDTFVIIPVYRNINLMMGHTNQPIYSYEFSVNGNRGPNKWDVVSWNPRLNFNGASHFDDIGYLFNFKVKGSKPVEIGSTEYITISRMTTMWTNFAEFGNPNGNGISGWEPQQINQETCLLIDSKFDFQSQACEQKRTHFWKEIYANYFNETGV